MPVAENGSLREFTQAEIDAMEIETFGVRDQSMAVESRRVDENVMTRPWFCKWESRYDFVELVLGDSKLWTDAGTTKLSRLVPNSIYGRHPFSTQIMATRIDEIRPHGAATELGGRFPIVPKAEIRVYYEHVPFAIRSDSGLSTERQRYTSRGNAMTDVETFTLPGGTFKYARAGGGVPNGVPVPFNVSFTRPVRRFQMTWHMLPNDLYETDGALFRRLYLGTGDGIPWLGTVNKEPITFPGLGNYTAGQLLLEGVDDRSLKSPLAATGLAALRWDVTFKFAYSPRGWLNLFYHDSGTPANSGYYPVSVDGVVYTPATLPDNYGLFNCRDHNDLWNPHLAP